MKKLSLFRVRVLIGVVAVLVIGALVSLGIYMWIRRAKTPSDTPPASPPSSTAVIIITPPPLAPLPPPPCPQEAPHRDISGVCMSRETQCARLQPAHVMFRRVMLQQYSLNPLTEYYRKYDEAGDGCLFLLGVSYQSYSSVTASTTWSTPRLEWVHTATGPITDRASAPSLAPALNNFVTFGRRDLVGDRLTEEEQANPLAYMDFHRFHEMFMIAHGFDINLSMGSEVMSAELVDAHTVDLHVAFAGSDKDGKTNGTFRYFYETDTLTRVV